MKCGYHKNDPASIQKMFNSIAKQYDKTNSILSFNMQKYWNRTLLKKAIVPAKPEIFLDLCCGTGAITFSYLKKTEEPLKVYMLDFSQGMLECAKSHAKKHDLDQHDIHYLQADAQIIPLLNNSVHCATIAYGIRNVKDSSVCIKDVYRVLKPGGSFGILELTQPKNPILKFFHSKYLKYILPLLGKLATSNKEAYVYLCNSIHTFIPPDILKQQMLTAGFTDIKQFPLSGGIATILVGTKPS
jgi:demethylmenaquinone methyltransferase/2-methoxy-6-polyprenyl-1,4-benzoquinol methylase